MRMGRIKSILLIGLLSFVMIMVSVGCGSADVLNHDDEAGEEAGQGFDLPSPSDFDAEYFIDYENGTIPIGDLPVGTRVADLTWEWEFRQGVDYSDLDWEGNPTEKGAFKPVTWIIVAKNHYSEVALELWRRGMDPHVTLLSSEELIGLYTFDNSTDRDHEDAEFGYSHWGDSGSGNATSGLRPWLNSEGLYSSEGFYEAFSDNFKSVVLYTPVPNRGWQKGEEYITEDLVFIPSTTELGDDLHTDTYSIGAAFPFFSGPDEEAAVKRRAWLGEWIYSWEYWTRSPVLNNGSDVRLVNEAGGVSGDFFNYLDSPAAGALGMNMTGAYGVRPVLNIRADVFVTEIE